MPPTMSVKEPMIPRKSRKDRKNVAKNLRFSVVSQTENASSVVGVEALPLGDDAPHVSVIGSDWAATLGW
jgi:hypothetical protein